MKKENLYSNKKEFPKRSVASTIINNQSVKPREKEVKLNDVTPTKPRAKLSKHVMP